MNSGLTCQPPRMLKPDGAVALQVHGDLVAVAVEVPGVGGAGAEDGVEEAIKLE